MSSLLSLSLHIMVIFYVLSTVIIVITKPSCKIMTIIIFIINAITLLLSYYYRYRYRQIIRIAVVVIVVVVIIIASNY